MKLDNIYKFIKDEKVIIILTFIYLLFRTFFEKLLNTIIVTPILSNITVNFISDIIFLIATTYLFFFYFSKRSNRLYISNRIMSIAVILLSFYFFYRFFNSTWAFIGLNIFPFIKYLDIIPLFLASLVLLKVFPKKKNEIKNESNVGFYLDNSLGEKGKDLLKREKLAEYIAGQILKTNSSETSFAIGISSEWGNGKTSFFDLLERTLKKDDNIIIKFNPWMNINSINIIKDFFNSLSQSLSKYNYNISNLITDYANILSEVGNDNFKDFTKTILKLKENKSLLSEFNTINSAIKNIEKRIIVFIDDLDRLYKEEIIQVIKLIRNSANFGNVIFIVAYDRNYIINAIKGVNDYNSEFFLEKIFQLELTLPNFERQIIQKKIYELLHPRLTEMDKVNLSDLLLKKQSQFESNIFNSNALNTLRDATRFSNSFLIAYNYLKGETVLADLLNVEMLRLKYPSVYELMFYSSDDFLETKSSTNNKTRLSLIIAENEEDKKNKYFKIETYLTQNYKKLGVVQSDIGKIISIIRTLFPTSTDSTFGDLPLFYYSDINVLSVNSPSSFARYSHYRLLDNNLSEIEFSRYRTKPFNEFCERIKYWTGQGLRWELKVRFEDINAFNDKDDFEKIIKAIFCFARIPKNKNIESDYSGFDFDNLYDKIVDKKNIIDDLGYYKDEDEYSDFIYNIFIEAPEPYMFDIEFIYTVLDRYSSDFIVPENKLNELRLMYFEKYLSTVTKFDDNIWHLFHYNDIIIRKPRGGNSYEVVRKKNPNAIKLFIKYIEEENLDGFLYQIITKEPFDKKLNAVSDIIPKMFGSYEQFEEFLNGFSEENYKYLKEFKDFYIKFKETGYKRYIEFDFKDIDIRNKQ